MTPVGAVTLDGSSPEIRPQDDMFGHVNGGWYETVEIRQICQWRVDSSTLMLEAESQVAEILRDAAAVVSGGQAQTGSPTQQTGDLFTSLMDEAAVEAIGLSPLTEALDLIVLNPSKTSPRCSGSLSAAERTAFSRATWTTTIGTPSATSSTSSKAVWDYRTSPSTERGVWSHTRCVSRAPGSFVRLLGDEASVASDAADRVMQLETRLARPLDAHRST